MSTRAVSSDDLQIRYLQRLYGDADARGIAAKIEVLLAKYSCVVSNTKNEDARLSEKDVLLITYGDTLTDGQIAPLQVLQKFYREYLRGIFELVHILPFHPYSSDDGFSVIDYFSVRDDLGSWSDIENLAKECRLMVDAVVNHVSSESDWFMKFLRGDPDFSEFFVECDPKTDISTIGKCSRRN